VRQKPRWLTPSQEPIGCDCDPKDPDFDHEKFLVDRGAIIRRGDKAPFATPEPSSRHGAGGSVGLY